jgi:hypothetical protein
MEKEKINENYDLMDENEKFAMRYGAKGRDLGDVIRDNPGKITNPEKILYAWDKGMNLRKDGSSKYFLDRIEKAEMDNLKSTLSQGGSTPLGLSGKTDGNGISSEPERDIWGNDLFKDASFGNREEFTFDLREEKSLNLKKITTY